MKRLLLLLMKTKVYKWLLIKIIPFIRLSTYYTSLRGKKYHAGHKLLKPGHIILTIDKKKLTTLLVPGDFTHAALCVDKGEDVPFEIVEMTHTDWTESFFFDICKESDRVVILECVDFSDGYVMQIIDKCKSFKGVKYDVEFKSGVEALFCSELVYESDFKRVLQVDTSDLAGLGREYVSPDDLYRAKNVRIVWDSDNVN